MKKKKEAPACLLFKICSNYLTFDEIKSTKIKGIGHNFLSLFLIE